MARTSPVPPAPLSGGASLPPALQHQLESKLGADFSDVRVHQGHQAMHVGALAYTRGTDIHFAPGQYQPGTESGRELIAHELTHVVQQGSTHGPDLAPGLVQL